jgi:hypothetical protein
MGLFDKLFSKSHPAPVPTEAANPQHSMDGLPPSIAVKGLKDLAAIEFGEDDMDLPVHLWGHFDKALLRPWINEIVLTSSKAAPPSLSQIRALIDDLHAHFGIDGHGDGPFDKKDLHQWDGMGLGLEYAEVARLYYFYGDNLTGIRYQKDEPFSSEDLQQKPSIQVHLKPNVEDPEMDCTLQIKHWDKIKERYLI